jgi:hypothetical protein
MKGCLEGGSGKNEKARKMLRRKYKCPNCGDFGHRKNSPKCPLNSTKKRQVQDRPIVNNFNSTITIFIILFLYRKRKPKPNRTKGGFPKEPSTKSAQGQDGEDGGTSSPPRMQKHAVMKKLTPKKKRTGQ